MDCGIEELKIGDAAALSAKLPGLRENSI